MSKFNTGAAFDRTLQSIVSDYAYFLLEKNIISDEEFDYFTNTESGQIEILDGLLEKVYEEETLPNGKTVPTLSAFAHYCKFVIKEFHGRPVWNRFVKDLFDAKRKHRYLAFMASRGLGKSFFQYVLYTSFMMFTKPGYKIVFFANTPDQLIENIRFLKHLIDSNEALYSKKDVDKGKDLKWTERQIEYNYGMVYSRSAGTSPRSLHVDEVIIDDIRPETSQLNDEELVEYTLSQAMPIIQRRQGLMSISGTPIHLKDYYHYFMNTEADWNGSLIEDGQVSHTGFYSIVYPAYTPDGEPYLSSVYSKEQLEEIRKTILEVRFQREYLLKCTDKTLTIFGEHLLQACTDKSLKYFYAPPEEDEFGTNIIGQRYAIGVDVATSGAASADYSVFTVLQAVRKNKGYKKIVRHIIRTKGMEISEQINMIQKLSKKFNNAVTLVEKNNVGVALIQELKSRNVNVKEFTTTKANKENMIRYLVTEMENGNFWFGEDVDDIIELKKELLNFGVLTTRAGNERMEAMAGHDDMVMSLAIANQATQNLGAIPKIGAFNLDN